MKEVKHFLESSSIHGLYHLSSAKSIGKYFWIFIVLGGFIGAIVLIHESFSNWKQSPISTTIETLPISQIHIPNVTICPPKNSFLNLNYDLLLSENLIPEEKTRMKLFAYSFDVIQTAIFDELLVNLSKLEESSRYYNWYHGYTDIEYPVFVTKVFTDLTYCSFD